MFSILLSCVPSLLDSYSASLIPVCLYSVFGRGERFSIEPLRFFYVLLTILLNFYVSHWEKYNTGVLFLPWAYVVKIFSIWIVLRIFSRVRFFPTHDTYRYDVGMWTSIIIYLVNWYFGANVWSFQLTQGGLKPGNCLETILYTGALMEVPLVFYHIYKSYKDKTGKMRSFFECIRPLIPLVCFIVVIITWINNSPSNIIERDPRAV